MPGMYAVTSIPEVRRTLATLRKAEFGFLGVVVNTRVHTPRRCGEPLRAGVLVFSAFDSRPLRTSWAIVGTRLPSETFRPKLETCENYRAAGARRGARSRRVRLAGPMSGPKWGRTLIDHVQSPAATSPWSAFAVSPSTDWPSSARSAAPFDSAIAPNAAGSSAAPATLAKSASA